MGMFDMNPPSRTEGRSANTLAKLERVTRALNHQEPDRVPISDFFWGRFKERWRQELGLAPDADPYTHYDLDWIVTIPNMDPFIRSFETLSETAEEVVVKTGYGAIIRKKFDYPMPEFIGWDTDTIEKLAALEFDDPHDRRRYFDAGDNQIAGVGDGFERNTPAWIDTVKGLHPDFPVFGSIMECSECLTRLVGQENTFLWMGLYPEKMGECINRIGQFYLDCTRAQIDAAKGLLDGLVIWGDVAYKHGLFFSPTYWREYFKPWVKAMVEVAHAHDLPVIYHGCGNTRQIFEDYIEIGVDGYNPLEVKAGMDAPDLRREYGQRMAFCGGSDIQLWETGDPAAIRREVLRLLQTGKGGGLIFQSDHSVSSDVSGHTYDMIVKLVREYGQYPLDWEIHDVDV
jgi:hypothetical protein